MKHLLNGIAIAAVLAIAAPVWAQTTPMSPGSPGAPKAGGPPAAGAPAGGAPAAAPAGPGKGAAAPMQRHRPMRRMARGHRYYRGGPRHVGQGDAMTEELNRQELARIQGGGAPPGAGGPPPGGMPPGGPGMMPQEGPRPSGH